MRSNASSVADLCMEDSILVSACDTQCTWAHLHNKYIFIGHTVFMGGFADDTVAKKWLKEISAAFIEVRHTGKACFADMKSEDDVQKAIEASDDQHRCVSVSANPSAC